MNHSSFIDLKIASKILYPRPYNIVCTSDGFVGKEWLMRSLGCIPTQKFVTDLNLVRDIDCAIKKHGTSVLMYPEASYSFDGTATPPPQSIARFIRRLGVPVVMIRTYGAFSRDPLYNGLRLRQVEVSATVEYILSPEEIKGMTDVEIQAVLDRCFDFDNFKWQKDNKIKISEAFRAEGLERVLYKCPHCLAEGKTKGSGATISCECGAKYTLDEYGELHCESGETKFTSIPQWYAWERESVRREIEKGTYDIDIPVDISVMVDFNCIYKVGEGKLCHNSDGFSLVGCEGKLNYAQKPLASYSLYADYFWYEIGDMVCIGNNSMLYYCFPKDGTPVAKLRLATEEMYKSAKGVQV